MTGPTWWREPAGRFLVALPPGWSAAPNGAAHSYRFHSQPAGPGELCMTVVEAGPDAVEIEAREVIGEAAAHHAGASMREGLGLAKTAYSERATEEGREYYLYTWEIGLRTWVSVWSYRIAADLHGREPANREFARVGEIIGSFTL